MKVIILLSILSLQLFAKDKVVVTADVAQALSQALFQSGIRFYKERSLLKSELQPVVKCFGKKEYILSSGLFTTMQCHSSIDETSPLKNSVHLEKTLFDAGAFFDAASGGRTWTSAFDLQCEIDLTQVTIGAYSCSFSTQN